jgi:hypothetical protein
MIRLLQGSVTLLFIFLFSNFIRAQVNLTATVGTPSATYPTVKAAFDAINIGTHQGIINIVLTDSTVETAPAVLNASGSGAAIYTSINISTTVVALVTGNFAGAIIKLNGADNVTLDGRIGGAGRNIIIENTSTAAATAAVWISSTGAGAGAKKNIIRNCELLCGVTQNTAATATYGVVLTGTAVTTSSAGADNDSNQILENRFTKVRYGIVTRGESATNLNEGTIISGNIIGPTSHGPNQIGKVGIFTQFENNCAITYNTIQFIGGDFANTSAGADRVGIALQSESWSATVGVSTNYSIHHNIIHDVLDERTFSAIGILHAAGNSGSPTNHMIYNNFIYNIRSNGTSTDQGIGIAIAGGAADVIAFNSISMTGGDIDPPGTTTATQSNCGIRISSTTPINLTLKNNIINVDLSSNTASLNHYAIVAPTTGYPWGTGGLNYNDYYINSSNAQMKIGGIGTTVPYTPFATFANWKTNFSATQDLQSKNVIPDFTSPTNLHILPGIATNLESKGISIPGITTDIDDQVRPGPAGSIYGGATAPDIGADEFDGIPVTVDLAVTQLVLPSTTGCHGAADTVRIRIDNLTTDPIDLTTDSIIVNGFTTGANPTVFPQQVINTGTLAGSGFILVTLATNYNMTASGVHTFHAYIDAVGDNTPANDSLTPVSINISGGTVTAATGSICIGSSVNLSVSGYTNGGTLQWQASVDGTTWNNIPGGTTANITDSPTDTTYYRVVVCGINTSSADTVIVVDLQEPVANDVTRCGAGQVTLTASGVGTLSWYNVPSGGTALDTGSTFTANVTSSTSYYVEASSGAGTGSVGAPNNGQTTGYTLEAGLFFDVIASSATIQGVYVYPVGTGPGTVDIAVKDNAGINIQTITVNLTGTPAPGIQTYVPLNFTVPNGTGYSLVMLQRTGGVANLVRDPSANITGGGFPFILPGILTITSGKCCPSAVSTSYYYFYNWQVASGCSSPRDTVNVTITPSDTIIANIVTNPICSNSSTAINVTSINPNYVYAWSPATGLSGTTGPSNTTTADTTTTYTITAIDNTTLCQAYTYATVNVDPAPVVDILTNDTSLCINTTLQLETTASASITNDVIVGFATNTNTATSTVILGPYGGLYGGARHQYLILGSELSFAGLSAGVIGNIGFEVTALNSVPALSDFTIKIDTTSLMALTTSYITGLQQVYYNPSYTPILGWNVHDIAPFNWDGVSNIIVEVCFNNADAGVASGNASVRYTPTTGTNTVNYYRADNDPNVCAMLSGTPGINRPDIRFYQDATISYSWSPSTGISNTTIPDPVLTALSTNTYTLQVTDNDNGCMNQDQVNIVVSQIPIFTIGNDTTVCDNVPATPFAIFGSDPTLNYVWFDNSTASGTVVYGPGTYYATGTNAAGCSSSDTMVVGTVSPSPVDIDIDVTGTNTADLDAGSGFSSYVWSNSQTAQVTTVIGNGTYWVHVTDGNGCTNADTVSIIFSLDIQNENGEAAVLNFYPNPSNGIINMAGSGFAGEPLKMEIMELNGKIIFTRTIQEPTENFIEQMDLSMVAEGTYIVKVSASNKIYTSRIIIARK